MNTTLEYYNENAEQYVKESFAITARDNQDMFLSFVKRGGPYPRFRMRIRP